MARVVFKTESKPKKVEADSMVCMCGLSKNQPFCDGSHLRTEGEDKDTYCYDDKTRMKVEEIRVVGSGCQCEGEGGCGNCSGCH